MQSQGKPAPVSFCCHTLPEAKTQRARFGLSLRAAQLLPHQPSLGVRKPFQAYRRHLANLTCGPTPRAARPGREAHGPLTGPSHALQPQWWILRLTVASHDAVLDTAAAPGGSLAMFVIKEAPNALNVLLNLSRSVPRVRRQQNDFLCRTPRVRAVTIEL